MTGSILPTKILVDKDEAPTEEKKGSIYIPSAVIKSPNIGGTVVLTGEGTDTVKMSAKVGDKVLYYERSAQPVKIGEKTLFVLDIRDVLYLYQ